MYCKKCGRKLRSEARFCDHCGQSTKETKSQTASKTSGTTRTQGSSKARTEYEKNKKQRELERQRVQKNRRTAFFLLLVAVVVAAVLGFASYNMTKSELDKEKQTTEETLKPEKTEEALQTEDEAIEETEDEEASKNTPKPTEESGESKKNDKDYEAIADICNIYRDDRMDSIRCPYPESFEQGSKSNKNTVISLVDPLNDGSMMICAETVGTGKSASALMKDYAAGVGGSIKKSRAGDGWYEISFERNNKLNHRKAVIVDGLCVYYDFSYDVDSGEASSYEEYIEYIDYYLDKELTSATKKQNSKE